MDIEWFLLYVVLPMLAGYTIASLFRR